MTEIHQRVAVIENGVVVNIIVADMAHLEVTGIDAYVVLQDAQACDPGWLYDGAVFTNPKPPLTAPELPPPMPYLRITGVAFKRRMTAAERIAIRALAATNAHVYDYMDLLDSAPSVHLDDADVIGGLHMLETAGVLATGRAAAILSAPIQAEERPGGV